MIISLPTESTMVSDTIGDENGVVEQSIIVSNYKWSDGIDIRGSDGESVYIPYRIVSEVIKVMKGYLPKKTEVK